VRKLQGGSRFVNDVGAICNWIWVGERAGPAVAPPFYASVYGFLGQSRRECGALIDGD